MKPQKSASELQTGSLNLPLKEQRIMPTWSHENRLTVMIAIVHPPTDGVTRRAFCQRKTREVRHESVSFLWEICQIQEMAMR
ncbi:MAG: hypothetical protein ACR2G0_08975 [Chthoniobacterales bacterium]